MTKPFAFACTAALVLLAGCRHRAVNTVVVPPPPTPDAGPVMVSVPPPTHHASESLEKVLGRTDIPVVQPVPPQKKKQPRRAPASVAAVTPAPQATQPASASTQSPAATLGKLTAGTENPAAARVEAEQAIRTQQGRMNSLPSGIQNAHPAELDQARRFLRTATESWNGADYTAALALATKTKVLLDDLQK